MRLHNFFRHVAKQDMAGDGKDAARGEECC
ncbi:MAG: hypothetical protein JWN98_2375 [Abditibacteriota bacterium]|nr:hypothetical protein [Abditibacteriota bacterium]